MDDGKQNKNVEGNSEREHLSDCVNDGDVFQPIWVRRDSIFFSLFNRRFMESQLRLVFYLGTFLWFIFLLTKTI